MTDEEIAFWSEACEAFLAEQPDADAAHDLGHVRRVVRQATQLGREERADLRVVLPAAYLHDCVAVQKNAPERTRASALSARSATAFLRGAGYDAAFLPAIAHAIEAHSFSAGIAPETLEARVVQDADRLDALGAVGIARAFMVGGAMGLAFAHPTAPFPDTRPPDEKRYALDHFFAKLLRLEQTMQTPAGRREARRRTAIIEQYLEALRAEMMGA